jgi:phosphoglycerate kinase
VKNLLSKVDVLLVGGGMAYTFLKAQGMEIGGSLLEADKLDVAREVLAAARAKGVTFVLPMDHVIANARRRDTHGGQHGDPGGLMGLDIGSQGAPGLRHGDPGAKTAV